MDNWTIGQLGDGTTINRDLPTRIGTKTYWQSVSAGISFSAAIKLDGTRWAWGRNSEGALGDGSTIDRHTPTQMGIETNFQNIATGRNHSIAIKDDGGMWIWGGNSRGQLGDGTGTYSLIPKQIQFLDSDGDGQPDSTDSFPYDRAEQLDTDGDRIGNNADADDDNDGIPNEYEVANGLNPLLASDALLDNDGDGIVAIDEYLFGSFDSNVSNIPQNVNFISYSFETAICKAELRGDSLWKTSNSNAYAGNASRRITGLENSGTASLSYEGIFNAGYFSFVLKTSTEEQYDKLILSVMISKSPVTAESKTGRCIVTLLLQASTALVGPTSADFAGEDAVWIDSIVLPVNTDPESNGIHNETRLDDDCDGYLDADEIAVGSDPINASSLPLDTHGDFISNTTDTDDDGDGISDVNELLIGTNPLLADTDNDGISDCDEVAAGTDPLVPSVNIAEADFNGDGNSDILWRNQLTGQNWLWTMNGRSISQSKEISAVDKDWIIVGRGDFNDDGKSDILWRNNQTGLNYIWLMDGFTNTQRKAINTVADLDWQIWIGR
jgi:hypothetical protein